MISSPDSRRFRFHDWTSGLALIPLACALIVLGLGWGLGVEGVVRLRAGLPAMVPETALAIVLASLGTLAAINRWPAYAGTGATLALGVLVVSYFRHPLMPVTLPSGDGMAFATGFCLICLGVSVAALSLPLRGARAVAMIAGGLCALASGTALMAHVFVAVPERDVLGFREMAVHTAGSIFLLNLTLILSSRDRPHFRGLLGRSRSSVILRGALMLSILLVLGLCGLTRVMTLRDWITPDFRLVFLCSAMITLLVSSALVVGYQIDRLAAEKMRIAALESASDRALQSIEINSARDENLRILGQIVAGVAHDFNNALTALRGNLELMQADPDKAGAYLGEAIRAADRAAGLTGQLLESGRQTRLEIGEGDVVAVAEQVIELFRRVAPKNISIVLDADPSTLDKVPVDDATLERALLNLLVNARDAMPAGGDLTIGICQRMITNGYAATFNFNAGLTPQHYVVIEVTDTGTGMDEATIARSVQPYFSTKGVGKGSGLGLASVNGVCQQLGGGLLIRSAPGQGTTVVIALPVGSGARLADAADGAPEAPAEIPYDILLLASTSRRHREFLGYLHRQGRMVRHVRSEEEALEFLDCARLPSVVLIDEGQFGGVDGGQVKAEIEQRFPDLPVVYVGDYGEGRFATEAARPAGGADLACA